jgi:hypothetical protein
MFKLKNHITGDEKRESVKLIKERLDRLPKLIPEIKYFETGINFNDSERAFDIVLISEFENETDLEIYSKHPDHLSFMDFYSPFREISKVVDYYF